MSIRRAPYKKYGQQVLKLFLIVTIIYVTVLIIQKAHHVTRVKRHSKLGNTNKQSSKISKQFNKNQGNYGVNSIRRERHPSREKVIVPKMPVPNKVVDKNILASSLTDEDDSSDVIFNGIAEPDIIGQVGREDDTPRETDVAAETSNLADANENARSGEKNIKHEEDFSPKESNKAGRLLVIGQPAPMGVTNVTRTFTKEEMQRLREKVQRELQLLSKKLSGGPITYDRTTIPQELQRFERDVFQLFPNETDYDKSFKSPCWKDQRLGFSCLPYFYIGGAPKCATTDLWAKVTAHPELVRHGGKEPHWWTRGDHPADRIESYIKRQYKLLKRMKASGFDTMSRNLVTTDASACTLWHNNHAARSLGNPKDGPPYLLADVMRAVIPSTKFIFILRNPTDRQYSEYLHVDELWRKRKSAIDFHYRIESIMRKFDSCLEQNRLRHCVAYYMSPRVNIGMYSVHLREWFYRFPRDQILVLHTEDWQNEGLEQYKKILHFLNLSPMPDEQIMDILKRPNEMVRKPSNKAVGPVHPITKELLDEFFVPFNEDLVNLMGDEKFLFKRSS